MSMLNEKGIIENVLRTKQTNIEIKTLIFLLAKYCYTDSVFKEEAYDFIDKMLTEVYGVFYTLRKTYLNSNINYCINKVYSKNLTLNQQEKISIYKSHLELFKTHENDLSVIEKKVLFTLMVLSQYGDSEWINTSQSNIFTLANTKLDRNRRCLILHKFSQLGLIKLAQKIDNNNFCLGVEFAKEEVVHEVTQLKNLGNQYLLLTDARYTSCEKCEKLILRKTNNSNIKFCKKCACKEKKRKTIAKRQKRVKS